MKKKLKEIKRVLINILIWLVRVNGIRTLISLVIVIFLIVIKAAQSAPLYNLIDFTIFFTVITALFLDGTSKIIEKLIGNKIEDSRKLTVNYIDLAKSYQDEMITFSNEISNGVDYKNLKCLQEIYGKNGKKIEMKIAF